MMHNYNAIWILVMYIYLTSYIYKIMQIYKKSFYQLPIENYNLIFSKEQKLI